METLTSRSSGDVDASSPRHSLEFAQRETSELQDPIFEQFENEPDFIDKLTLVPLPLDTVQGLIGEVTAEVATAGDYQEAAFKQQFLQNMQQILNEIMQSAEAGDNVTFEDLMYATAHADRLTVDALLNDDSFVAKSEAVQEIPDNFAQTFVKHPELDYISDAIDDFTIPPEVHSAERPGRHSQEHFLNQARDFGGQWVPELRNGVTVWVSKQEKHHQESMAKARTDVENAFVTDNSEPTAAPDVRHDQWEPQTKLTGELQLPISRKDLSESDRVFLIEQEHEKQVEAARNDVKVAFNSSPDEEGDKKTEDLSPEEKRYRKSIARVMEAYMVSAAVDLGLPLRRQLTEQQQSAVTELTKRYSEKRIHINGAKAVNEQLESLRRDVQAIVGEERDSNPR